MIGAGAPGGWGAQGRLDVYRSRLNRERDEEVGWYGAWMGPRMDAAGDELRAALGWEWVELGGRPLMAVYGAEPVAVELTRGGWRWMGVSRFQLHDYVRHDDRDSLVEELDCRAWRRFAAELFSIG